MVWSDLENSVEVSRSARGSFCRNPAFRVDHVIVGTNGRPPLAARVFFIVKLIRLPSLIELTVSDRVIDGIGHKDKPHLPGRYVLRGGPQKALAWFAVA